MVLWRSACAHLRGLVANVKSKVATASHERALDRNANVASQKKKKVHQVLGRERTFAPKQAGNGRLVHAHSARGLFLGKIALAHDSRDRLDQLIAKKQLVVRLGSLRQRNGSVSDSDQLSD